MKSMIGRICLVAGVVIVMGTIGRLDFSDQLRDAARSQELRARLNHPPLSSARKLCFSPGDYLKRAVPDRQEVASR